MSVTCACATDLVSVENQACSQLDLGNQIVKIFIQKMDGSPFNGAAVVGTEGGDLTDEADWDAKLGATGDDKIVVIPDVTGAIREPAEPNIEEGNDVPYDGAEVIDRPQSISFDIKYFSANTFQQMDDLICAGKVRMYFLDNNDYLWVGDVATEDGIVDVSILTTTMGQAGIGTKNKASGNIARWNNLCQPRPFGTKLPFLKSKR